MNMSKRCIRFSALALCVSSGALAHGGVTGQSASAVTVMTPNLLESSEGNSDWFMGWHPEFSVQVFIAASQLASVPQGSGFTGMSFRCSARSPSFPVADVNMPRFDVMLSPSVFAPMGVSGTFADNIGPGAVQARTGSIVIPADAFPSEPTPDVPSANVWYVPFTNFFVYPGGDLCVTMRVQGTISNFGLFDGYAFSPTEVGSAVYNYGNANGTTGSLYGPLGIRFAFEGPTECPGDLNFDSQVDDADFVIFLSAYNILDCADPAMPASCSSDLNTDGVVDDDDFVIFLAAYNMLVCK